MCAIFRSPHAALYLCGSPGEAPAFRYVAISSLIIALEKLKIKSLFR